MENPDTAAEAQKIQMDVEKDCPNTFTDTVMNFFAKKDAYNNAINAFK
ncbi:hypothetical protein ABFV83_11285 [Lacrimispora sp. BS-2]|uniref:Uncharacterized protein n=1 Tax=Lacrimispora sp. BS-2 TaxID=3151850 RepID=A0AAU7PJK2_9FIRM